MRSSLWPARQPPERALPEEKDREDDSSPKPTKRRCGMAKGGVRITPGEFIAVRWVDITCEPTLDPGTEMPDPYFFESRGWYWGVFSCPIRGRFLMMSSTIAILRGEEYYGGDSIPMGCIRSISHIE